MVQEAAALLEKADGTDFISRAILSFITILDDAGATTVNLNYVGAFTFMFLLLIRLTFQKHRGVDWYALIHAIVTGYGSLMAVYLDAFATEALTGLAEPRRSCQCHGALTSLHRILPAITMGYSMFDLLDGLTLGIDFALHGAATLFIMVVFVQLHAPHVITPYLLMEVSTINLAMVRADFFSETMSILNQAMFAFFFMLFRIIVCPLLYVQLMIVMNQERTSQTYKECFSPWLFPISAVTGVFFHCLNAFWFYKIVRKIRRKLSGKEGIKANNDLKEEEEATSIGDQKKRA